MIDGSTEFDGEQRVRSRQISEGQRFSPTILRGHSEMKSSIAESFGKHGRPSAPEASRIVASVSIAGALVFGLIVLQPLLSGGSLGFVHLLFAVAAIHLLFQAGTSAYSWKAGAMFAMVSLALIFVAATSFVVQFDFSTPAVFAVSAIVSIVAVKIQVDETKRTRYG